MPTDDSNNEAVPTPIYSDTYLDSVDADCHKAHQVYRMIDAAYDLADTITRAQRDGEDEWLRKSSPKEAPTTFTARAVHATPHPVLSETVEPAVGRFLMSFKVDCDDLLRVYPQFEPVLTAPRSDDDTFDAFLADMLKRFFLHGTAPWLVDFTDYSASSAQLYASASGTVRVSLKDAKGLRLRPYIRMVNPHSLAEVTVGPAVTGTLLPPIRRLKVRDTYTSFYDPDTETLGEDLLTIAEVTIYTDTVTSAWRRVSGRKTGGAGKDTFTLVKEAPAFSGCKQHGVYAGSFFMDSLDTSGLLGRPPFWELALIQIALLNAEADNGYYTGISQIPLLFGVGLTDAESPKNIIVDGPGIPFITSSVVNADLRFVELNGTAAAVGADRIQRLLHIAESIAGQTFAGRAGGDGSTATAQVLSNADTTYYNQALAPSLERALNHMLRYVATLLHLPSDDLPPVRVVPKGGDTPDAVGTVEELDTTGGVVGGTSVGAFIDNVTKSAGAPVGVQGGSNVDS